MPNYYVHTLAQSNGDHEVHVDTCAWLPKPEHRLYLGVFSNCADAVRQAKKTYPQSDGCAHCSPACDHG